MNRTGHGKAADWWSFGAIIYEMVFGIPPFYTQNRTKLYENIKKKELEIPQGMSAPLNDLISRLLVKDPHNRLGSSEKDAEEIMSHEWFECINWAEMRAKTIKAPYTPQLEDPKDVKHFSTGFTSKDPYGSYTSNLSIPNSAGDKWEGFSYEGKSLEGQMHEGNFDEDFDMSN